MSDSTGMITAARYYGPHDIRIEEVVAQRLRPGTVAIAPAWCGICGTDLHEYLDGPIFVPAPGHPHPLTHETAPVTLGHEMSGTVVAIGDGVDGLAVGDGVVVEPYVVCDACPPCRAGSYNLCQQLGFIGLAGAGGGLSDRIVVEQRWVHPVGDLPLDQAALIEPLAVGYHAFERSGAKSGDVAFVGGAGPIGLLTAAVLKAHGLVVIMSELSEARKAKALESGVADRVLDPSTDDIAAEVLRMTGGAGADVAFECSSVNAVLDLLIDVVRPSGVIVNVSIWAHPATIDMQKLVLKEIDLRGTIAYVRDHPTVIELVRSGRVDVTPFITSRIALTDLLLGFETLIDHKDTTVKVLVHP